MLRRRSMKLGFAAVGLVAPLAMTSACTEDGAGLHIECNIAPEVSENGCLWDSSSEACVFDGRLNVNAASSYVAGFRVVSGLKPRVSTSPPRAEPNGIQLSEAEVELRSPGGAKLPTGNLPNPYTLVTTGYVSPGGTGLLQVELLPPTYVALLRDQENDSDTAFGQIVAAVTVRGKTDGQVEVETAPYYWPIRLITTSPVIDDGTCIVVEEICSSLRGIDAFADACLCDGTAPVSCDQRDPQE